jgi:hypothetical protein
VQIRVDDHYAAKHDKFIVVDGEAGETGKFSLNCQRQRQKNAENITVLHDAAGDERYGWEWSDCGDGLGS